MKTLHRYIRIVPALSCAFFVFSLSASQGEKSNPGSRAQHYIKTAADGITVVDRVGDSPDPIAEFLTGEDKFGVPTTVAGSSERFRESTARRQERMADTRSFRERMKLTQEGLRGDFSKSAVALEADVRAKELFNRSPAQTFTVTISTDAPDDNINDAIFSPQTLRAALQNADKTPEVDMIDFAVSTVTLGSPVSGGSSPLIIDGTQSGGGKVLIDPNFGSVGGIWFSGGGHAIKNLKITRVGTSSAIALLGNNGNGSVVQGCEIYNCQGSGINFNYSTNNIIGGMNAGEANIIYGLTGNATGAISMILSSNNNRIIGNYVGTPDGFTVGGNSRNGILDEGSFNYMGFNVLSGNSQSGISRAENFNGVSDDSAKGSVVEYNKLGVTADGLAALSNGVVQAGGWSGGGMTSDDTIRHNIASANSSVGISCASINSLIEFNICGMDINIEQDLSDGQAGIAASRALLVQDNWISGNTNGIALFGPATVRANVIGADDPAKIAFGNLFRGIQITTSGVTIGGDIPAYGNIISGNGLNGIYMSGRFEKNNVIVNNKIGVDESGNVAIPNGGTGIRMEFAPDSSRIYNNVIAANGGHGIHMTSQIAIGVLFRPDGHWIYNNMIGVGADGSTLLPNHGHGIRIDQGAYNIIGHEADSGNVIVDQDSSGIFLNNATGNVVVGNRIGVTESIAAAGNHGFGIMMMNSDSNEIGGTSGPVGNLIGDNDSAGIAISGAVARENVLAGNAIGVEYDSLAPAIGNAIGVVVSDLARNNWIGKAGSEVWNSIIGNDDAGVIINSDSNYVQANYITNTVDTPAKVIGAGDGVIINGNGNRVGGSYNTETNIIRENEGTGVLVQAGERNTIRGNIIHGNGLLGIDLLPDPGVTVNDPNDLDAGANMLRNYPTIDSGFVANNETTIYGRFDSDKDTVVYTLEFYLNEECDSSHYGEGERYKDSLRVGTIAGWSDFQFTLNEEVDSNNLLTMTVTDDEGNTSEFSACWPAKVLRIVDADTVKIKDKEFELSRVQNDIPTLAETKIGTFRTDTLGVIRLGREQAEEGDTVKAWRKMWEELTPKRPSILPYAYRVYLDNGKFDDVNYNLEFKEIDTNYTQSLIMDHTTVAYNLYVSIEFDASPTYVQSLSDALRLMTNYLYDVYDGQLTIDSVIISDDYLAWTVSDVRIRANNHEWPNSTGARLLQAKDGLKMPRRWYGDADPARNLSITENPLNLVSSHHFRTIGHELGHYMLAFKDEYKYAYGMRCPTMKNGNYGYMDGHYAYEGPPSSELSWSRQYEAPGCKNTLQWWENGGACWYWFEAQQEQIYDAIPTPIITPEDRNLSQLINHFLGPNDSPMINYDVGAKLTVVDNTGFFGTTDRLVTVRNNFSGVRAPKAGVYHIRKDFNRLIFQGLTSDSGQIIALGAANNDVVFAAGPFNVAKGIAGIALRDGNEGWLSGESTINTSLDNDTLDLSLINGSFPLVVSGEAGTGEFDLVLSYATPFTELPSVKDQPENASETSYPFTQVGNEYQATVVIGGEAAGNLNVEGVDADSDPFFFPASYVYSEYLGGSTEIDLNSASGDCEFESRELSVPVDNALVVSTRYIVRRDGIELNVRQSGQAHSISLSPNVALPENSVLSIRYDASDLQTGSRDTDLELSLRIYRWNNTSSLWELVGGEVDTTDKIVTIPVDELGTFALFTTDIPVGFGCGDVDGSDQTDITDAVYIINYIFAGGAAPVDSRSGDVDCNAQCDVTDAVYLINFIFAGGPAPCAACK